MLNLTVGREVYDILATGHAQNSGASAAGAYCYSGDLAADLHRLTRKLIDERRNARGTITV